MSERWRPVPEHVGYEASSTGRIRRGERELGPDVVAGGYRRVAIQTGPRRFSRKLVHRLVASAFIGTRPDGWQVNHLNGKPSDNRPENLEYVTPSGNVRHSFAHLGRTPARGSGHGNAVISEAIVRGIRSRWAAGEFPTRRALAATYGISEDIVGSVLNGQTWRHVA